MRYYTSFVVVLSWLGVGHAAEINSVPEVARQAIASHAVSQSSLSNLGAKVKCEVTWLPDSKLRVSMGRPADELRIVTGAFTRSGDQICIDEKDGKRPDRTVIKNLTTNRATLHVAGTERASELISTASGVDSSIDLCNGIVYFLIRPIPPDYEAHVSLESAVSKARKVTTRREMLDGVETVYLDLDMAADGSRIEIWLDPRTNYLWRKIVNTPRGVPGCELKITEFAEPVPGIFCPARVEKIVYGATKVVYTISDIKLDVVVPPKSFKPVLPPGSTITNEIDGKIYVVGEGGTQKIIAANIAPAQIVNAHDPASGTAPTPLIADVPHTFSWSRIVLIASAMLALVGAAVWYRRRKATA